MIIGISGQACSGKDTAADILVKQYGFVKISLADLMKRICKEVFDFSEEQLWGPSEKRNEPDKRYLSPDGEYLSARKSLQLIGTEWGRKCYEDVWVDYTMRISKQLLSNYYLRYTSVDGVVPTRHAIAPYKGVVIADCRFSNEISAIKKAGGKVLRIKRPGSGLVGEAAAHASEMEQKSIPDSVFDYVIDNDGTIEDLAVKLAEIMH